MRTAALMAQSGELRPKPLLIRSVPCVVRTDLAIVVVNGSIQVSRALLVAVERLALLGLHLAQAVFQLVQVHSSSHCCLIPLLGRNCLKRASVRAMCCLPSGEGG